MSDNTAERCKALQWYLGQSDYWLALGDAVAAQDSTMVSPVFYWERGMRALEAAQEVAKGIELEDKSV